MKFLTGASAMLAALIAGCGGGGEDGTPALPTSAPARSTALANQPVPAGFDFSLVRTVAGIRSSELVPDPARFTNPGRTYVSIWIPGPDGERLQLALLSLRVLQALDSHGGVVLQVPATVNRMAFEVFDAQGATTQLIGEIAR